MKKATAVIFVLLLLLLPTAADAEDSWNLAMIGADAAHAEGYLGRGIRVGIIDSGVNPHPDFADRLLPGRCFLSESADPEDSADALGHGTAVAGVIAAVAPEAELVPLKITEDGEIKTSVLCRAIYSAVDDYGCDVLNLSLGVPNGRETLQEAVEYAARKGVTVVAAVGNSGSRAAYYPAAYETVIGVGAVESTGALYRLSNHCSSVFLTAPGVDILTADGQGGHTAVTGCSFAVPHVAAAAAVIKSAAPSLSPGEIMELMAETARDAGSEGYDDYYGHGILDLAGCLSACTLRASYNACPRDSRCVMAAYRDLDPAAWYHDGVHFALERGMMNGVGDGYFDPEGNTSRAMVVTMLWRMEGSPDAKGGPGFSDVAGDAWYAAAVRWAAVRGIVTGYSAERFGPGEPVSREQLAAILFRYANYKGADTGAENALGRFSDADTVSDWAGEAMAWATDRGLIGGVSAALLLPGAPASRAQTATIFMRFCTALG